MSVVFPVCLLKPSQPKTQLTLVVLQWDHSAGFSLGCHSMPHVPYSASRVRQLLPFYLSHYGFSSWYHANSQLPEVNGSPPTSDLLAPLLGSTGNGHQTSRLRWPTSIYTHCPRTHSSACPSCMLSPYPHLMNSLNCSVYTRRVSWCILWHSAHIQ